MRRHEHIIRTLDNVTNSESLEHFSKVRLPRQIWDKACTYARLISELAGFDCECSGYLLADIDDFSGIPTGISYARDHEVGQFFVNSSLYAGKDSRTGKPQKTVGVWHSHPGVSTVPSEDDWTWLGGIYRCYARHNNKLGLKIDYVPSGAKVQNHQGALEIVENDYSGSALRLPEDCIGEDLDSLVDSINSEGLKRRQVKGPGYFISLIVNKYSHAKDHPVLGRDYHCLLALEDLESKSGQFLGESERWLYRIDLIDRDVGVEICEGEMIDEILDHTYFSGRRMCDIADPIRASCVRIRNTDYFWAT